MSENGSLQWCQTCKRRIGIEAPLELVDGTDPEDSMEEWEETYRCSEGHTGTYKVTEPTEENNWTRREEFYGACAGYEQVEV